MWIMSEGERNAGTGRHDSLRLQQRTASDSDVDLYKWLMDALVHETKVLPDGDREVPCACC